MHCRERQQTLHCNYQKLKEVFCLTVNCNRGFLHIFESNEIFKELKMNSLKTASAFKYQDNKFNSTVRRMFYFSKNYNET